MSIGSKNVTAALFTRMSTGPSCASVSATSRSRSSRFDKSAGTAMARPPAPATASTVSASEPSNRLSPAFWVRAATATAAPSSASRRAMA